jgi:hypothetical protein
MVPDLAEEASHPNQPCSGYRHEPGLSEPQSDGTPPLSAAGSHSIEWFHRPFQSDRRPGVEAVRLKDSGDTSRILAGLEF